MKIENLPLSEITPYQKNPRKNKKGIKAVKQSIEEFGFTQPIIVNAEQVILCGHTRYEAAKALNLVSVPVIIKEYHLFNHVSRMDLGKDAIGENHLCFTYE